MDKKTLEAVSKVLTVVGLGISLISGIVSDKLSHENMAEEVHKAVAEALNKDEVIDVVVED